MRRDARRSFLDFGDYGPDRMPLLLIELAGVAAYAGWASWPPYLIPLFGAIWVAFDFAYFGFEALNAAAGATLVFLVRKWAFSSMLAAGMYAAGFAIHWLLG
jgi:hypothetical protein